MYTLYEDPGHGWLKVPMAEIDALGIRDKITGYSYRSQSGRYAFLEEDCDMSTFFDAKGWKTWADASGSIISKHTNRNSHVRSYPGFWQQ